MSKKAIIIDDDAYIRDLYQEVLASEEFEVTVAQNGQEGLDKLQEGGFDVVLMDVMMPKLDGVGVLTKLKETPPKIPNGPILLLTNLDHDPILEKAKALGAHSYILKADILPPALVALINDAIQSTASKTPPPGQ